MKNKFANILLFNKFLNSIEDVLLREEIVEYFHKIGKQGAISQEDTEHLKDLFQKANVSYEEFDKLVKRFRR